MYLTQAFFDTVIHITMKKKRCRKHLHFQSAGAFSAAVSGTGSLFVEQVVPSMSRTPRLCRSCQCCHICAAQNTRKRRWTAPGGSSSSTKAAQLGPVPSPLKPLFGSRCPWQLHWAPSAPRARRGSCADSSLQPSEGFRKAGKSSALPGRFPLRFNST